MDIGFAPIGLDEPYRVIISEDPIGFNGGTVNLYEYAGNNPVNFVDLMGLCAEDVCIGEGIGFGIAACLENPACANALRAGAAAIGAAIGSAVGDKAKVGDKTKECKDDKDDCPPCRTVSGKIVPVGTIAYRPLDTPEVIQHGIEGPHYNLYRANQAPKSSPKPCKCFWERIRAVRPHELPPSVIQIEPFAD
jgi:hypothetical protein